MLLVHRAPTCAAFPNVWDLPGGHIEAGESTEQAITRELHEELDIVVHPSDVEAIAQPLVATHDLRVSICRIHLWRGEPVNACPAEHDRIGWFAIDDLPHLDLAHQALADLLGSVLVGAPESGTRLAATWRRRRRCAGSISPPAPPAAR